MFEDLVTEYNSTLGKLNDSIREHRSYMLELHRMVWKEVKPMAGNNGRLYLSENYWVAPDCWSQAFDKTSPEEIINMIRQYLQSRIDENLTQIKQVSDENKWVDNFLHPSE